MTNDLSGRLRPARVAAHVNRIQFPREQNLIGARAWKSSDSVEHYSPCAIMNDLMHCNGEQVRTGLGKRDKEHLGGPDKERPMSSSFHDLLLRSATATQAGIVAA